MREVVINDKENLSDLAAYMKELAESLDENADRLLAFFEQTRQDWQDANADRVGALLEEHREAVKTETEYLHRIHRALDKLEAAAYEYEKV